MEFTTYFKFLLALVFVLDLIGLMAWGVRRFGVLRGAVRPANGKRRIQIVEISPIDSKRKLQLVRRDQTEHLLLLGTTGDLVIETCIAAPPSSPTTPINPGQSAQ